MKGKITLKMSEKVIRNHIIIHILKIMNKIYIYVCLYIYSLRQICLPGLTILSSRAVDYHRKIASKKWQEQELSSPEKSSLHVYLILSSALK